MRKRAKRCQKWSLILARLQKLRQEGDCRGELQTPNDALSIFRFVKRDRLGYPDSK